MFSGLIICHWIEQVTFMNLRIHTHIYVCMYMHIHSHTHIHTPLILQNDQQLSFCGSSHLAQGTLFW